MVKAFGQLGSTLSSWVVGTLFSSNVTEGGGYELIKLRKIYKKNQFELGKKKQQNNE